MMTAKFGPAGNCDAFYASGRKATVEAPAWLREIGLDAYEFQAGNGLRVSDATLTAIGNQAQEHGIAMSLHAPYFISLSGVDPEKRLKSITYIKDSLHAASLLGAAMALAELRNNLSGNIMFLFQPAEEKCSGAEEVISTGADHVNP